MRFARLRNGAGQDVHLWVDDGFDSGDADWIIKTMKKLAEKFDYTFSDNEYRRD